MFMGALTFNMDWVKSFFPRITGYSANPPYWRVRILWENDRLPGFQAFADPHSTAAQAYAAETNAGIAYIMANSAAIDSAYVVYKGAQTGGSGSTGGSGGSSTGTTNPTGGSGSGSSSGTGTSSQGGSQTGSGSSFLSPWMLVAGVGILFFLIKR